MKKIFVWCLIVMFGVLSVNLIGCKPEKPKEPAITEPVIQPPKVPEPPALPVVEKPKPVEKPIVSKPIVPAIAGVTEKNGVWAIRLSKLAKATLQKNVDMTVRLNIGYMIYESKSMNGDVIEIKPEWHPGGRVTAGIWRAGPFGTGKYISSMEVNKSISKKVYKVNKSAVQEETTIKGWIKGNLGGDPPPSAPGGGAVRGNRPEPMQEKSYWDKFNVHTPSGTGAGAIRGNRPEMRPPDVPKMQPKSSMEEMNCTCAECGYKCGSGHATSCSSYQKKSELGNKTYAQADVLTSDELKKPKPEEQPKAFQPKTVILYDATTGNSVTRMKEVWK